MLDLGFKKTENKLKFVVLDFFCEESISMNEPYFDVDTIEEKINNIIPPEKLKDIDFEKFSPEKLPPLNSPKKLRNARIFVLITSIFCFIFLVITTSLNYRLIFILLLFLSIYLSISIDIERFKEYINRNNLYNEFYEEYIIVQYHSNEIQKEYMDLIDYYHNLCHEYRGLDDDEEFEIEKIRKHKASDMNIHKHLEKQKVIDAKIPNIGEQRKFSLIEAGIESAADIDNYNYNNIINTYGIGEGVVRALVIWRNKLIENFKNTVVTSEDKKNIRIRIDKKRHGIEEKLKASESKLLAEKENVENQLRNYHKKMKESAINRDQAKANLNIFNLSYSIVFKFNLYIWKYIKEIVI